MHRIVPLVLAVVLLGSCRNTLSPVAIERGGGEALTSVRPDPVGARRPGPGLTHVQVHVVGKNLRITGRVRGLVQVPDALMHLGGAFDIDSNWLTGGEPKAYGDDPLLHINGEYTLRPLERENPGGGRMIIRSMIEPGPPDPHDGGWGRITGYADLTVHNNRFTLRIPLAALGGDDGNMRLKLGLYDVDGAEGVILDVRRNGHGHLAVTE